MNLRGSFVVVVLSRRSYDSFLAQFWQETDKAAYLFRQYFFNNLHDRLSTRPFLSLIEKKWLAFQVSPFSHLYTLNSRCSMARFPLSIVILWWICSYFLL